MPSTPEQKEHWRKYSRRYYYLNREKILAKQKIWYKENREAIRAARADYVKEYNNRQEVKDRQKGITSEFRAIVRSGKLMETVN